MLHREYFTSEKNYSSKSKMLLLSWNYYNNKLTAYVSSVSYSPFNIKSNRILHLYNGNANIVITLENRKEVKSIVFHSLVLFWLVYSTILESYLYIQAI